VTPSLLFKCLSEEIRLNATLLIYRESELCVCELVDVLGQSQPKISRHLAQLRNCGVLTDRRQEQWVFYAINTKLPAWALAILDDTCRANPDNLAKLQSSLSSMKHRPPRCRAC